MKTAIIGLPMTGKSSLFTILTGVHESARMGSMEVRVGVAKVPDARLTDIFEATHDLVAIADSQGALLYLNQSARGFFEMPLRGPLDFGRRCGQRFPAPRTDADMTSLGCEGRGGRETESAARAGDEGDFARETQVHQSGLPPVRSLSRQSNG
jgi:PAS domain-containing protein